MVNRDVEMMQLIRCLVFIAAKFNFLVTAVHISGQCNTLADALSRNRLHHFKCHAPQAQADSTQIPPELLDLLFLSKRDWMQPGNISMILLFTMTHSSIVEPSGTPADTDLPYLC